LAGKRGEKKRKIRRGQSRQKEDKAKTKKKKDRGEQRQKSHGGKKKDVRVKVSKNVRPTRHSDQYGKRKGE